MDGDRPGTTLVDRYEIERELGRGAMATVYRARDRKHDRLVAIKVLHPEIASSIGGDRFLSEIRIAAQLTHPNIVSLFDSGQTSTELFYVMPYIAGETLRDRLERDTRLPVDEALAIAREVADALGHAHRHGVVHRDVKPENILLCEGHASIADFGISRAIANAGDTRLTLTGIAVGTPAYMSPEQAAGDPSVDARSDIYSLACVVYEMLTGEQPFAGSTPAQTIARRFVEAAPQLRDRLPGASESLERALSTAMAMDPAERFHEIGDFARELPLSSAMMAPPARRASVAVLPFVNLSPDPDNEYLSDGLTDELIADLSKIGGLHVISRTSSMLLKGSRDDVRTIARRLGVQHVIEGSVRKAGMSLRITAQVIDAAADRPLWSDKFAGTIDDVFDVQERVSREIVRALDVTLSIGEDRRLSARPVSDPRVLDYYLRARYEIAKVSADALGRATNLLLQGLEFAPNNPLLEATLAYAEVVRSKTATGLDERTMDEVSQRIRAALARAPDLAQGHFVLGLIAFERGRLKEVEHHLLRAVAIEPTHTEAMQYLTFAYMYAGATDQARTTARRLVATDPLWPAAGAIVAGPEVFSGRFAEGIAEIERCMALNGDSFILHWMYGYALSCVGRFDAVAEQCDALNRIYADSPYARQLTALVQAIHGDASQALATLEPLGALQLDQHILFHIGESYAAAGEHERALGLIEHSVANGFYPYAFIAEHDPLLSPLREHARFAGIIEAARQASMRFAGGTEGEGEASRR